MTRSRHKENLIDDVAKIASHVAGALSAGDQWDRGNGWDPAVRGRRPASTLRSPYLDDPYPFFARWRASEPVFYDPAIDHWVVAGHEDVRRVLRDADAFSALNVQDPVTPWPPDVVESFAAHRFGLRPNLSNNDPPSHTHVRGFLRDAFNPRRVQWLESHVERLAHGVASIDSSRACVAARRSTSSTPCSATSRPRCCSCSSASPTPTSSG